MIKPHKAHNSAVWQIICIENQTRVVSGANDCKLILWDSNMKQLQAIDLRSVDKFRPEIRSIDFNESTKTFLVGTRGAEIIEIDAKDKKPGKALVSGHVASSQDSELCGLACHPTEQLFITCGSDKKIKIWEQNKLSFSLDFAQSLYSVDWSPCGKFVIVGDNQGSIHTLVANSLKKIDSAAHKSNVKGAHIPVMDVKISPDGKFAAFGV